MTRESSVFKVEAIIAEVSAGVTSHTASRVLRLSVRMEVIEALYQYVTDNHEQNGIVSQKVVDSKLSPITTSQHIDEDTLISGKKCVVYIDDVLKSTFRRMILRRGQKDEI